MTVLKGKSASPGAVVGAVLKIQTDPLGITGAEVAHQSQASALEEWGRAESARSRVCLKLEEIRASILKRAGAHEAAIIEAHLMMIADPELEDAIKSALSTGLTAEAAVFSASTQFETMFAQMEDEYLRERAADVRDVADRWLRELVGKPRVDLAHLGEPCILVAHDLTPSDTAGIDLNNVLGLVTEIGGKTSHTAILARTLEIPAVLGVKDILAQLTNGDLIAFDGERGEVVIRPDSETQSEFKRRRVRQLQEKADLASLVMLPSVTRDGRKVKLVANIGTPTDLSSVKKNGAEGVGLYRTEFLYMDRKTAPTEEEQFEAYKTVLEQMSPRHVVIRTLDVGGDKQLPYLNIPKEDNPFLGNRAVRYCLQDRELFKVQLRALLRASPFGRLGIMFPMISSLEEIESCKTLLEETRQDLLSEGKAVSEEIEIGVMIEVPSAAMISDVIAKHVDFMSIGTNDLIQYTLAVDRMNAQIGDLYDPYHPAVLRLVHQVITNGHREGIWVGMCGEMAGMPELVPILLGMGLTEFSMAPTSVLKARAQVRSADYQESNRHARAVLACENSTKVKAYLKQIGFITVN